MYNIALESFRTYINALFGTIKTAVIIEENTTQETIIQIMKILCTINIVKEKKNHRDTMYSTGNEN